MKNVYRNSRRKCCQNYCIISLPNFLTHKNVIPIFLHNFRGWKLCNLRVLSECLRNLNRPNEMEIVRRMSISSTVPSLPQLLYDITTVVQNFIFAILQFETIIVLKFHTFLLCTVWTNIAKVWDLYQKSQVWTLHVVKGPSYKKLITWFS